MPLVDDLPEDHPLPKPDIKIFPEGYSSPVVDTDFESLKSLMVRIEGMRWNVTYYKKISTPATGTAGQSVATSGIYMQYWKIENFVLAVTNPLSDSQDSNTKRMVVTGSANVYPVLVPNEGDMFTAETADGRIGVFEITNSEKKTIFHESAHVIDYTMVDYLTPERASDFQTKTVKELVFLVDYLNYGKNPFVSHSEFNTIRELNNLYSEISEYYFSKFYNRQYGTFMVPDQVLNYFDPYVARFMVNITETHLMPNGVRIRQWNTDDPVLKAASVYDAVFKRKKNILRTCFSKVAIAIPASFGRNSYLSNITFAGCNGVIYPTDPEKLYGAEDNIRTLVDWNIASGESDNKDLLGAISDNVYNNTPYGSLPLITDFKLNENYVLSQSFYRDDKPKSKFEYAVKVYLEGGTPDNVILYSLATTYTAWGSLERYYYLPIVLAMMKINLRGV